MNFRVQPLRFFLCCAMTLLTAGCSSSKKSEEPEGATVSGLNRFMDKGFDKKNGQFNRNVVSRFDQMTYSADAKVKKGKFRTDQFAGKHDYTGSSAYKAKEFSQSGKMSRAGSETFGESSKESRDAGQEFGTTDSRYGSQQARQGDQEFGARDKAFKTRMVSDAAKSQKKNVRPEIIPKDEGEPDKTAYSEAEVRRLVNRN